MRVICALCKPNHNQCKRSRWQARGPKGEFAMSVLGSSRACSGNFQRLLSTLSLPVHSGPPMCSSWCSLLELPGLQLSWLWLWLCVHE